MKSRRRGAGEGSVYRRADGIWVGALLIGHDENGRRRRRVVYGKTRTEAAMKLKELQAAQSTGTLTEPKRITVGAFLKQWLDDSCRLSVRETTFENYSSIIRLHVAPHIGGVRLTNITPANIQSLYAQLERQGKSPRLRQLVHAVLHRAFNEALMWGFILRNPCSAVKRPRVPRREINCMTGKQVRRLLDAAKGNRLEALYVIAVATGMRQGEILALQWGDIDLKAGTARVQRTLVEVNGQLKFSEPKTARSRRLVELPSFAIRALQAHRGDAIPVPDCLVFTDTIGGRLRKQNLLRRSWWPLLERAGLPKIRFHSLRHTHASMLLSQGTHPKVVQERLGHSSISITLDTYSHVMEGLGREAANKLDDIFATA